MSLSALKPGFQATTSFSMRLRTSSCTWGTGSGAWHTYWSYQTRTFRILLRRTDLTWAPSRPSPTPSCSTWFLVCSGWNFDLGPWRTSPSCPPSLFRCRVCRSGNWKSPRWCMSYIKIAIDSPCQAYVRPRRCRSPHASSAKWTSVSLCQKSAWRRLGRTSRTAQWLSWWGLAFSLTRWPFSWQCHEWILEVS